MVLPLILSALLASNATGKTIVRSQPGSLVSVPPYPRMLMLDDANTVAHLWWNGGALVDTKGGAWAQNGTVPMVARSGKTPPGAGPFSDTAHYSRGSPNALNFASGDWTVIVVAWVPNPAVAGVIIGNTTYPTTANGWWAQISNRRATINTGAGQTVQSVEQAPLGAVSVFCVGRAGSNDVAQLNLGTFTSTAKTYTPNTSDVTYVGRNIYPGNYYPSTIYEILALPVTPTAELCTAAATQVKSKIGITAW